MEVARLSLVLNSVETKNNQYKNIEMLKQKRCLQMVSKMYFNFFIILRGVYCFEPKESTFKLSKPKF